MTDEVKTPEESQEVERIPRKVRDLVGRMSARIDKLEKLLEETKPAAEVNPAVDETPSERMDTGHAERRVRHERPAPVEEPAYGDMGLPPELFAGLEDLLGGMITNPPAPAGTAAPQSPGASTTPSTPPPAENPEKNAHRRADSIEAHLDSRYFGTD